jgi:endonuclease/exonuclease/phosphatase family metal-dependent hydrolase
VPFRFGDKDSPKTEAAYTAKLQALAATIDSVRPDVLALQEIGSPDALADLVGLLDGDWNTALSTADDHRHIRVGLVSRPKLTDIVEIIDLPEALAGGREDDKGGKLTRMGRGALRATVRIDGKTMTVLTCHLKSKLLSFPGGRFAPLDEDERARFATYALNRRAAEAGAVRMAANAFLNGRGRIRNFIVLGDLNDGVEAATTQLMIGTGGSELGTPAFDRPDEGDKWRLWDVAPLIPVARRYSRIYRNQHELIDHILVSRAVASRIKSADSLVDPPGSSEITSITDTPGIGTAAHPSDHAPLVLTLK